MKQIRVLILLLCFSALLNAQHQIRIGLFQDRLMNSFVFHCISGEYKLVSDTGFSILKEGDLLYLRFLNEKIITGDGVMEAFFSKRLSFEDISGNGIFRLRPVDPSDDARNYQGELEVSVSHNNLQIVNIPDFEQYLAGVVQTEGGPSAPSEYYKAQAILCRTYAIKNFHTHAAEGFNLCDHSHCQAYKGMNDDNRSVTETVLATYNLVLTGRYFVLVNAVYHSNSGGQTQRASDLWINGEEYLQAVLDPFSENQPNSTWRKTISFDMWRNYLIANGMSYALTAEPDKMLIQQRNRRQHFILENDTIMTDRIRLDFNLRSGFFDMELKADSLVFKGKGYGHGVGMSQEGAMEMARQGYSFSDILRFYYHQVQIRDILDIPDKQLPEEFRLLQHLR